jgi:hypothetical protein
MGRDISLDGAEISVIKALGFSGSDIEGSLLLERCADLELSELMDTLKGLMSVGYVDCDSSSFHSKGEMEKLHFRVNSGYSKELRDALDPNPDPRKSTRVRRE